MGAVSQHAATPVRDLIEQFRSGTAEERQEAIGSLLKLKEVPLTTLRKLIAREGRGRCNLLFFLFSSFYSLFL